MKAILIAFLLLPYVAFVPSSTLAREPKEAVTIPIGPAYRNPPFIGCDPFKRNCHRLDPPCTHGSGNC
ncbi:hypothetical protein AAZX31_08G328800 [Glycine max]|uniref:Uncharacterized protein n=1 Tax=Glycine max TaxID=3847 RepID=C6T223_SOYBN|nr:uncharacterized protein LOC114423621 [Glycine soja]ACU15656.1 unknown [Glycine max]KAG5002195.1 hypothetical protein JHK87_023267 [Glycine soja]KAG5017729.1 hypothetical protein JHK85_023865 [Glycine max]KAG5027475.1 hypothetical protein JHK86_023389 [Glycine max]KAH1054423.1 hypothetical protein GYH30_023275 [Glycine max]